MRKREGWKLMRSGGDQVSWSKSKIHPWQFVCARTVEDVEDPELYSLGNTPGRNVLPSNAIFELRFMLEDKNARTALRHGSGERRCCEAAANSDKVKMCHAHRAVGALKSMFRRNLLSDPENGTIVLSSDCPPQGGTKFHRVHPQRCRARQRAPLETCCGTTGKGTI